MSAAIAIILVNWNGISDTLECLESLSRVTCQGVFCIVVDNGSEGDDAHQIRASYPQVTVLETGENLGFTGGNNIGIRYALDNGADYVLCLNNDTVVAPDFLSRLLEVMEKYPNIGITGAAIYFYDRPADLHNVGGRIRMTENIPADHMNIPDAKSLEQDIFPVDWVEGSAMMMRRKVAEATGGFCERYFAYYEDVDLCLCARTKGWQCVVVPSSRVWHKIGASSGGPVSQTAVYYFWRNAWLLVRRHATSEQYAVFRKKVNRNLLREWKLYFKQCIVFRNTHEALQGPQLVQVSVSNVLGSLGCKGTRNRWRFFERFLIMLMRSITQIGRILGKVLHPLYLCRRSLRGAIS